MLMDGHSLACERVTPTRLVELPPLITNGDGVVVGHHAFGLNREDPIQIAAPAAAKGRATSGSLHRELVVELVNVALAQEAVGWFDCGDAGQPQLLRQAALPGAEAPFATS